MARRLPRPDRPRAAARARAAAVRPLAALLALVVLAPSARAQLFGTEEERQKYTAPETARPPEKPAPEKTAPRGLSEEERAARAAEAARRAQEAARAAEEAKKAAEEQERKARLSLRERQLEELQAMVRDFEREAAEYREDARGVIQQTFDARVGEVRERFEKGIRELEIGERQERLEAIALFERFLARYPDDARYTPDAMTRLAELYYEKSEDDAAQALVEFEQKVKMGAADDATPDLQRNFDKSIALYQQIIVKFPDYRLVDAIYYLLGYCLNQQGEPERARDTFKALIERYPNSRYVPEAWVRIGEYWFDYTGPEVVADPAYALRESIAAYEHVIAFKDSNLYDKALYKLGWAHYRLDDFDKGVDAFVQLLDYYESLKEEGKETGGDLRAEALQYTAISFADDKWGGIEKLPDGTERFLGVPKMVEYFKSRGGRPYEYELFRKLADVLFDSTRYKAAVDGYRIVIERNPTAPDCPQIQDKIVTAFARDQDKASAFAEREKLVRDYGEKSAWAQANKGNQAALQAARELVESSLLKTAQYHHAQAVEYLRASQDTTLSAEAQAQKGVQALESYRAAAKAYGEYIEVFPHAKNIYDIRYAHADTLYNSGQFAAAADEYAWVRDSDSDDKYLIDAAYYVVMALQREIERQELAGTLEKREPCTAETCKDLTEWKAQEIPELRARYIQAADTYLDKLPTAEDAPVLSFKAGQTYFIYQQIDEARRRYEDVIARFPDKEVAYFAWSDILLSYLLVKDWLNVEKTADRMLNESQAVQSDPKKLEEKRLLKYGARFNRANIAMEQKKWTMAASLYVSIVDDTEKEAKKYGRWEKADAALYNAAQCFVEARRFESAMRTYERLFTDYSESPLAQDALFYVATNAEKAFEFDKAIDRYLLLVDRYPQSGKRVAAMFNAAKALEAMQRYPEAARAYRRYAELFPNEPDAPDQLYQAALLYVRMHDNKGLINGLQAFIDKYRNVQAQSEKVVQAHLKIALAHRELKNEKAAIEFFKKTISEYDRLKQKPENYMASAAAGQAAFELTELEFADFMKMKFDPKGKGSKLQKDMAAKLQGLAEKLEKVKNMYREVILKYRWPEWMTAALFRLGDSDEQFANKLLDAPCPAEVKQLGGEEGCIEYKDLLAEQMQPIIDRANDAYVTAQDKSQELRIVNPWTKRTNEKVCLYVPNKCVSLKDARGAFIVDSLSPRPLAANAAGDVSVEYKPPAPEPAPAPAPGTEPAPGAPAAPPPAAAPVPASAPGIGSPTSVGPAPGEAAAPAVAPAPAPAAPGGTP